MDQFVTTYRRDYLWPYIRSFGKQLVDPPIDSAGYNKKCLCRCYPPPPVGHAQSPSFDTQSQDWSRLGPMGPLLDPKLYPTQVGKSPETNTMREDQPNTFLKKLHEKYPFLYEILQTSPTADLFSKVNSDRMRSTYQVDYCEMEEYPPDALLRSSGVGVGPCEEPTRLPGDPYRPNQTSKSFKASLQSNKRVTCISGSGQGGTNASEASGGGGGGGGGGGVAKWVPNNSEYSDVISKIGGLIIKDKMHYHTKKQRG